MAGSASAAPELPATPNLGGLTALDGANVGNTVDGAAQKVTKSAGDTGGKTVEKAVPAAGKTGGKAVKKTTPVAQKAAGDAAGRGRLEGAVLAETDAGFTLSDPFALGDGARRSGSGTDAGVEFALYPVNVGGLGRDVGLGHDLGHGGIGGDPLPDGIAIRGIR